MTQPSAFRKTDHSPALWALGIILFMACPILAAPSRAQKTATPVEDPVKVDAGLLAGKYDEAMKMGRTEEALRYLRAALELDPDNARLKDLLGQVPQKPEEPVFKKEQEKGMGPLKGIYEGLSMPWNSVGGSFDGKSILASPTGDTLVLIPEIGDALGWGAQLGWRGFSTGAGKNVSFEASYQRSSLVARWSDGVNEAVGDAAYTTGDFLVQYRFLSKKRLGAQFIAGYSVTLLEIRGGSYSGGLVGDTDFGMRGTTVGLGLVYDHDARCFLDARVLYRSLTPYTVRPVDQKEYSVGDNFNGDGLGVKVGINFVIL